MPDSALVAARSHERRREWSRAAESYRTFFDLVAGTDIHPDEIRGYASALRQAGKRTSAREVIESGMLAHPNDKGIFLEALEIARDSSDWDGALAIANRLIEMDPAEAEHLLRLGRVHARRREPQLAETAFRAGLGFDDPKKWHRVIKQISKPLAAARPKSTYRYSGGFNSLGGISHETDAGKYFTKLTAGNWRMPPENGFYVEVASRFPELNEVCPKLIDSRRIGRSWYLTLEALDEPSGPVSLPAAMEVAERISAIPYSELSSTYVETPEDYRLLRKASVANFFSEIHTARANTRLFSQLKKRTKPIDRDGRLETVIERLEAAIVGKRLYEFISPQEHYGLVHGDFIGQNFGIDPQTGNFKIFDWALAIRGPRFVDLAHFMVDSRIPYEQIRDEYVFEGNRLSAIERIFFLYDYIAVSLILPRGIGFPAKRLRHHILPALEDFEACVKTFEQDQRQGAGNGLLDRYENAGERAALHKPNAVKKFAAQLRTVPARVRYWLEFLN